MSTPRARLKPYPPTLLFHQDLGVGSTTSAMTASLETAKPPPIMMPAWKGTPIARGVEMKKPPIGLMGTLMPRTACHNLEDEFNMVGNHLV